MGLKSAKRSGIQAQTTLIPVFVTTLETRLLKSTISTDCLYKYRNTVRLFITSYPGYNVQRQVSGTRIRSSFFLFFCKILPFLVYADAFLREGILIGIEQEVELPPCGHRDHESLFQKLLNCAVASDIGHKLLHICPEVLHICHPG